MRDLISPVQDPLVTSLVKFLVPIALRREQLEVRPTPNCVETLKNLRGKNAVIMANHSDRFDPLVMFALSKAAEEDFFYLAAREIFDELFGLHGWLLQHCGAYSVIRGEPADEASKEKTISLIVGAERKLVEFPEGDVSGRDDEVLPLKEDGIRNIVAAQRQVQRLNSEKTVHVIPLAIYYQASPDSLQALLDRTTQIENALSIRKREYGEDAMQELHMRLAYVIEALIKALERRYGSEVVAGHNLNDRILRLCRHVVSTIAANFGIELDHSVPEAVLLYSVRSQLRQFCTLDTRQWGKYSTKLNKERCHKARDVTVDLDRLQQMLILESTMRQQPVSLDVAWKIVDRLELEVLGKASVKGRRTAWIDVGSPIDLQTYVVKHDWNERIVQRLNDDIRNAMFFRLQRTKKEHAGNPTGEVARLV